MKKHFYTLVLGLALIFAACNKHVDEYDITFNETPAAQAAAGTYTGTWDRILAATKDTVLDVPGTIVFGIDTIVHQIDSVTTATNYFASINFICDSLDLDVTVTATNIAYSNEGFVFFNDNPSNALKRAFAGRIDGNGGISISFPLTQKINGRIRKFDYSFIGTRSEE